MVIVKSIQLGEAWSYNIIEIGKQKGGGHKRDGPIIFKPGQSNTLVKLDILQLHRLALATCKHKHNMLKYLGKDDI